MKKKSYHVSPDLLREKHSSCSTILLDESTLSQPRVRITVHCLVFAIYYHIKNRDAHRTKDIFEEHLHPFIEETDQKKYFLHSPDPESINVIHGKDIMNPHKLLAGVEDQDAEVAALLPPETTSTN
ncbi:cyclin-Y-like protein 1 [Molossus nigricans]